MLKRLWRSYSELSFSSLKVTLTSSPRPKPRDYSNLVFGSVFTDHMLEIDWKESTGWESPVIRPYGPLRLDPSSSVFHYCTTCYEGFKVYSSPPSVLTFRPEANLSRFNSSAEAAGLPQFNEKELLKCIDQLIRTDKDWVPSLPGYSLYVRPNLFGTHEQLGVVKPKSAKLITILSPVGPYFTGGFQPISLYCDDSLIRAWPGGPGNKKLGGNYAPGIIHAENIRKKGYGQILWLSEGKVTESGVMNFFLLWNNGSEVELITSPINSTVLPGITRDSVLELARTWGDFKVSEKEFTIHELVKAFQENRVIEAFGAGTAAVICPVNQITYQGVDYPIPLRLGKSGVFTQKVYEELLKIQYGKVRHPWNHYIA